MTPPRRRISHPAAGDAANTQHTLSSFLGNLGGRQKSWMTATLGSASTVAPYAAAPDPAVGPPAKKRKPTAGRPPVPISQPATHPQQTIPHPTPLSMSHPSSRSSDSPRPANGDSLSQTASAMSSPYTRPPSSSRVGIVTGSILVSDAIVQSPLQSITHNLDASNGIQPAPSSNVTNGQTANSPVDIGLTAGPVVHPAFTGNQPYRSPYQTPSAGPQDTNERRGTPIQATNITRQPQPSTPPYPTPSSSSTQHAQPVAQGGEMAPEFRSARPPVPSPSASTLRASNYLTQEICQSALARLPPQVAPNRQKLIQHAIDREDWDCLYMHQVYCTLVVAPQFLPASITRHPQIDLAKTVISQSIETGETVSRDVLTFFHSYPLRLQQIAELWPREQQQYQARFLNFVTLSTRFQEAVNASFKRGYPPLVGELTHVLGITSPVFQEIVFTSMLRTITNDCASRYSVAEDAASHARFELACVEILRDCHAHSRDQAANNGAADLASEIQAEGYAWGRRLQHLFAEYDRFLCSRSSSNLSMDSNGNHYEQFLRTRLPLMVPNHVQPPPNQPPAHLNHLSSSALHSPPLTPGVQRASLQEPSRTVAPRAWTLPSNSAPREGTLLWNPPPGGPSTHTTMPQIHRGSGLTGPIQQPVPRERAKARLLPPPGYYLPMQREPNPTSFALHQAHLRIADFRAEAAGPLLYQYVADLLLRPTRLVHPGKSSNSWSLNCSGKFLASITKEQEGQEGAVPSRIVNRDTRSLRLRCIKWPAQRPPSEHEWARGDTAWPPYTYFRFNGKHLHPRLKAHYGKDQVIDLSSLLCDGKNTLSVDVANAHNNSHMSYLVAVEELHIATYDTIMDGCTTKNRIPKDQALHAIVSKLLPPPSSTEDDDIIIVPQSQVTISIVDPFTGTSAYRYPARSRSCLHDNCFDLETFLTTRRRLGDVSDPDVWKCPLCNGDARPQLLVLDEFLQDVTDQLRKQGGLEGARGIVVHKDGTWAVKVEEKKMSRRSPSISPSPGPREKRRSSSLLRQEVICLD